MKPIIERYFPEAGAGGFSRVDTTVEFYSRVNALLPSDAVVLDFGAGRGVDHIEDKVDFRRNLRSLRSRVKKLIGIDVDPVVLTNPGVHEAHVVAPDQRLPLGDETVDMIVSDWTFEHIQDPAFVSGEFHRVLKPGGWICARTPNRWGYVGIGVNLVPNKLHVSLLKYLQPARKAVDVFPTAYCLNTRGALARYFPGSRFASYSYVVNCEPTYFGSSSLAWRIVLFGFRFLPERFNTVNLIFLQKRSQAESDSSAIRTLT